MVKAMRGRNISVLIHCWCSRFGTWEEKASSRRIQQRDDLSPHEHCVRTDVGKEVDMGDNVRL